MEDSDGRAAAANQPRPRRGQPLRKARPHKFWKLYALEKTRVVPWATGFQRLEHCLIRVSILGLGMRKQYKTYTSMFRRLQRGGIPN